jgi:uroporphyrinogen decarboxylase
VDLRKAIEVFGDKHAIAGNIEPQVIQNGTNQQVYELCKIAIEKAKMAPNGYLLMAGCEVPVQAPPYNIYVMKKAVMEHGFYD